VMGNVTPHQKNKGFRTPFSQCLKPFSITKEHNLSIPEGFYWSQNTKKRNGSEKIICLLYSCVVILRLNKKIKVMSEPQKFILNLLVNNNLPMPILIARVAENYPTTDILTTLDRLLDQDLISISPLSPPGSQFLKITRNGLKQLQGVKIGFH
jgi:hypothetical protein